MSERFSWVIPDKLAGMERPGTAQKFEDDVNFLKEKGISVIVNLEEYIWKYDDFELKHIPINDFKAPKLKDIEEFVKFVHERILEKKRVVVHCYAGMGRTNLMIACYLVFLGIHPDKALGYVRGKRQVFLVNDEQREAINEYYYSIRPDGE